ncbi:hypothetical protein SLEP1_g26592 [Rubroshorea leprosula]|uniref:Uncharacterized protein n=1 Tax=Rubroshorea leprosula TaxID=152421 RepID=A0AAV5JWV2_9ROSI|nr:hypothetical protein SLEP1_g26592 [Rubroshorea leprosula]
MLLIFIPKYYFPYFRSANSFHESFCPTSVQVMSRSFSA